MLYIVYYRVSTDKQGRSGLGLDAQRAAALYFVQVHNGSIVGQYTEIETGTKFRLDNRPQLAAALAHCKRAGATLLIAKLDRLARNVHFISGLMESGLEFTCLDNPSANKLTLHVMAAFAEEEARQISARTRVALASRRARGGQLGAEMPQCRNLSASARAKGALICVQQRQAATRDYYADVVNLAENAATAGKSLRQIAADLNAAGKLTQAGKPYTAVAVQRLLKRERQAALATAR